MKVRYGGEKSFANLAFLRFIAYHEIIYNFRGIFIANVECAREGGGGGFVLL